MSVDLPTEYLGLQLAGPLVASASPLTGHIETLARLEAAGAAAVVLPSLFEEEIVNSSFAMSNLYAHGAEVFAEATSYLPELPDVGGDPNKHLRLVSAAKQHLSIPVIASLNGSTTGGWVRYARELEEAGADAVELNVYVVAADETESAAEVERRVIDLVAAVRATVSVPLAVKLSPYFTALAHTAGAIVAAGADGLVLFNRFYQPDIDVESRTVSPTLALSSPDELRLPLRWTGILRSGLRCSLAVSSGVQSADDVVKALMAGADVVMTTSALLRHGPEHLQVLHDGLTRWLTEHEYGSVDELRGCVSQHAVPNPDAFERGNYLEVLHRASQRFLSTALSAE